MYTIEVLVHYRNAKCGGLLAVRRLGAFHPEVLAPQFHVMVLSVLEEVSVYCSCTCGWMSVYSVYMCMRILVQLWYTDVWVLSLFTLFTLHISCR